MADQEKEAGDIADDRASESESGETSDAEASRK